MFKMFAGGGADGWPVSRVTDALKGQYGSIQMLGEDGPLKVYGVEDNGINFVVALMESNPGSGKVVELGFLARFVNFPVTAQMVEGINRNLHISVATIEGNELFLMAGLEVTGRFDAGQFGLILEAWRRDLMVTLQGLDVDRASMSSSLPAAGMEAALSFAANHAPNPEKSMPGEILSSFMSSNASKEICDDCHGKGERGLIKRMCGVCDGSGFLTSRR